MNTVLTVRPLLLALAVVFVGFALAGPLAAQTPPTNPPTTVPPTTPAPAAAKKKMDLPPAEEVTMETKDKVLLRATWLGSNLEKEAVPVILLPSWGTPRKELFNLAAVLQRDHGCAVIVPDWRGHGDSTIVVGVEKPLDPNRFEKLEMASMVEDIETCKRFLRDKNDAGELNLDMLVVIANHDLVSIAAAWCISDWNWPLLGGKKQGQFVKMFVMISPIRKFKSTSLADLLKAPLLLGGAAGGMTTVIMHGSQDGASSREAQAIETVLVKPRAADKVARSPDASHVGCDLFLLRYASKQVGEKLIDERWDTIPDDLGALIKIKLRDRVADFPWIKYNK